MSLIEQHPEQIIPALKVLSEPNRLRILCGLGLECRSVTDIIDATGLSQTNVSFHLRVLREAGFVRTERRGAFIHYCLADVELLRILGDLKRWADLRQAPVVGKRARPGRRAGRTPSPAKTREAA